MLDADGAAPPARDPVCGRDVRVVSACLRAEHHGTTYIFCSERCRALFDLRPELFAVGGLRVIVERAQERRT